MHLVSCLVSVISVLHQEFLRTIYDLQLHPNMRQKSCIFLVVCLLLFLVRPLAFITHLYA